MARKKEKVTAAKIMSAVPFVEYTTLTYEGLDSTVQIKVKTSLSIVERIEIVQNIVNTVFLENEEHNITYVPALKSIAIGQFILKYFTDIEMPTDSGVLYDLIAKTTIIKDIEELIDSEELNQILADVDELINFRKEIYFREVSSNKIIESLVGLVDSIKNIVENMDTKDILDALQENTPGLAEEVSQMIADSQPEIVTDSAT